MNNLFPNLTLIVTDGMAPMLSELVDWLMTDGKIIGLHVIILPLIGRVINIFFKKK